MDLNVYMTENEGGLVFVDLTPSTVAFCEEHCTQFTVKTRDGGLIVFVGPSLLYGLGEEEARWINRTISRLGTKDVTVNESVLFNIQFVSYRSRRFVRPGRRSPFGMVIREEGVRIVPYTAEGAPE